MLCLVFSGACLHPWSGGFCGLCGAFTVSQICTYSQRSFFFLDRAGYHLWRISSSNSSLQAYSSPKMPPKTKATKSSTLKNALQTHMIKIEGHSMEMPHRKYLYTAALTRVRLTSSSVLDEIKISQGQKMGAFCFRY
jgi:hypothetical protein